MGGGHRYRTCIVIGPAPPLQVIGPTTTPRGYRTMTLSDVPWGVRCYRTMIWVMLSDPNRSRTKEFWIKLDIARPYRILDYRAAGPSAAVGENKRKRLATPHNLLYTLLVLFDN